MTDQTLAPLIVAGLNLRQYWKDCEEYIRMDASAMIMRSEEMRRRDKETKDAFLLALEKAIR